MGTVAIRSSTHRQFCKFVLFAVSIAPQHNINVLAPFGLAVGSAKVFDPQADATDAAAKEAATEGACVAAPPVAAALRERAGQSSLSSAAAI